MFLNNFTDRILNDVLVVSDHVVKDYVMIFLGLLPYPVPAFVVSKSASA
jgi:hypothetical protein